jgi:hypothetical protein
MASMRGPDQPSGGPGGEDPNRDAIYQTIRRLMLIDVGFGLFLMLFIGPVFGIPGAPLLGAIMAAIGTGLYFFFGHLADKARRPPAV